MASPSLYSYKCTNASFSCRKSLTGTDILHFAFVQGFRGVGLGQEQVHDFAGLTEGVEEAGLQAQAVESPDGQASRDR